MRPNIKKCISISKIEYNITENEYDNLPRYYQPRKRATTTNCFFQYYQWLKSMQIQRAKPKKYLSLKKRHWNGLPF